jgi:hypothetical protein
MQRYPAASAAASSRAPAGVHPHRHWCLTFCFLSARDGVKERPEHAASHLQSPIAAPTGEGRNLERSRLANRHRVSPWIPLRQTLCQVYFAQNINRTDSDGLTYRLPRYSAIWQANIECGPCVRRSRGRSRLPLAAAARRRPDRGSLGGASRIESIAQAVSEQVQRQYQAGDRHPRPNRHPGCLLKEVLGSVEHAAPAWIWRLLAEAEERYAGLSDDSGGRSPVSPGRAAAG